jgi:uncharacterized protein
MNEQAVINCIRSFFPDMEAVYLFGSCGSEYERPDSDIDLAVLLPPATAEQAGNLALGDCWTALRRLLHRDVDVVNLRLMNTVFQHEIIQNGQCLYRSDETVVDAFEMLTMSLYQKLNEERAAILRDVVETGRVLRR